MTKRLIGAAALALAVAAPSQASAAVPKHLRAEYQQHYKEVATRHGDRAPGCDLFRTCKGKATTARVRKSNATLERMLYVPKPAPVATTSRSSWGRTATPVAPTATTSSYTAPTGGGGPEQFVKCESGGDWNAVNPSSGARGRYQLMPMHMAPGGICEGDDWSPSGQTRCANKVYAAQGGGAWSQCGG